LLPIKLTLSGGIGNQLFQLCAGIYLENFIDRKVIYDVSNLKKIKTAVPGNYTRQLEISDLILDNQLITSRYPIRFDSASRLLRRVLNSHSVVIEKDPTYDALAKVNKQTTAVFGYFQSAAIVNSAWPILKARFAESSKFEYLITSEKVNRIALHMRFGDYSDDPATKSVHGFTSKSYFERAIKSHNSEAGSESKVLVITDNQSKAEDFFDGTYNKFNLKFVSNPNPIHDLIEISRSAHVVMTNSTFSWWGAWIASKIHSSSVIYPRPWFADKSDPELPIYVNNWVGFKREFTVS
jgi:hypothetical protein